MSKFSWEPTPEIRRQLSAAPKQLSAAPKETAAARRRREGRAGDERLVRLVRRDARRPGTRAHAAYAEMQSVLEAGPMTAAELLSRCKIYDRDDLRHDASLGNVAVDE